MVTAGTRLGPYEVLVPIGAGGMGEVYRARDTRLNRDVAIKVLPDLFADDPERLARFTREAQTLAALNHPNIAHIHGLEESNGVRALVMELVEGPTLEERLKAQGSGLKEAGSGLQAQGTGRGLPLGEALDIARQIAEALEAAHEQGIIHRDLKPANIKVRDDGTVKVLDFGLAKALESGTGSRSAYSPADSPTLTTPAATLAGVILGTAAYMAPEQARGKPVDKRADIWAFGVVLFEMVTGTRAFEGELISDVLASVLKTDPDWQVVPAGTPAALRKLLRRCLEKDPKRRLQAIGEARIQIEDLLKGTPEETAVPGSQHASTGAPHPGTAEPKHPSTTRAALLSWAAATVAALSAVAMFVLWSPWKKAAPPASVRMTADLGADVSLVTTVGASAVLSPDGSVMAFSAGTNADCGCTSADTRLYVRHLDQLQATPLSGTEDAGMPFFSPDGQWIGFFAKGKLMKVSVTGGAPIALCDAPNGRGGTWGADGTIVFTPTNGANVNLLRVSSTGGKPEPLIPLEAGETTQRWPQLLPGGGAVLYTSNAVVGVASSANIVVKRLPTGERKVLQRDAVYGRYLPSGHLLYLHNATLFAASFDVNTLEMTGQPVPVIDSVFASLATAGAQFSVSDTGTLVYLPGNEVDAAVVPISWMDRTGRFTALRTTPANWTDIKFSPDGRRVAMDITDGKQRDIWIYEWARDTLSRFTFDPTDDASPVWSPDGSRIAFASKRGGGGVYNIYWQRADGTGDVQRLTTSATSHQIPASFDPTGRLIAFHDIPTAGAGDLMMLPIAGSETSGWKPGPPTVFLHTPATEANPMFSPDGRWIAYESNESGQNEIYVRPYPGPGGKWQISTAGGTYATWSSAKHELFYGTPDQHLMVVSWAVDGGSFRAEKPALWSETRFTPGQYRRYDIHPDGQRFAVSKDPAAVADPKQNKVVFVFNFFDELRRLASLKK